MLLCCFIYGIRMVQTTKKLDLTMSMMIPYFLTNMHVPVMSRTIVLARVSQGARDASPHGGDAICSQ